MASASSSSWLSGSGGGGNREANSQSSRPRSTYMISHQRAHEEDGKVYKVEMAVFLKRAKPEEICLAVITNGNVRINFGPEVPATVLNFMISEATFAASMNGKSDCDVDIRPAKLANFLFDDDFTRTSNGSMMVVEGGLEPLTLPSRQQASS